MTTTDPLDRRLARFYRPVDLAWLVALRVLFGLAMCASMLRFIVYGWIDALFVEPTFHFKYWGFGWVDALPRGATHALFWALAALALAVALGLCFRVSALLFVAGFTYLQLIDVTIYLNHYYLASLLGLLLALSPAGQAGSLDAWRRRAAGRGAPPATVPIVWLYLFRFQVGVVYTFAGLAKATSDWLGHAQPLRIWLGSRTDLPLIGPLFREEWAATLMSWSGFVFDTGIVWLLMIARVRPLAFVVLVVFHAVTRALFPIGMFPVIMVLCALVFFSPSWPRRWLRRVVPPAPAPTEAASALSRRQRAGLALVAAYALVQLLLPLRHALYGGNVLWHEQGMRFSWRVMVREKNGSVSFVVTDPASGRTWLVSPRRYLTSLQEREMSSQPDLILQLAHRIRDDHARRGLGRVEVRADAMVSLNGRRAARLIDPEVDLATIEDGVAFATWILPAPAGPPPHLRPLGR